MKGNEERKKQPKCVNTYVKNMLFKYTSEFQIFFCSSCFHCNLNLNSQHTNMHLLFRY